MALDDFSAILLPMTFLPMLSDHAIYYDYITDAPMPLRFMPPMLIIYLRTFVCYYLRRFAATKKKKKKTTPIADATQSRWRAATPMRRLPLLHFMFCADD
jgi:hypothetical protein